MWAQDGAIIPTIGKAAKTPQVMQAKKVSMNPNWAGILLIVTISGCASSPNATPIPSGAEADLQRIVCHDRQPTGSRISKRVCKTQAEWLAEAEESKEIKRNQSRLPLPQQKQRSFGN